MIKTSIGIILCIYFAAVVADDSSKEFLPDSDVVAIVSTNDRSVSYEVRWGGTTNAGNIFIDTETRKSITIDDYNFDGKKDFSISYLDEGMGVYTIHRVFLYSPKTNDFIEQLPSCGDEFLNLKIDKRHRRLLSTYYQSNIPRICITRPMQNLN